MLQILLKVGLTKALDKMELYCRACSGKRFINSYGEVFFKRCFLGEVISDSFIYKTLPCRNCKFINIFIFNINIEYIPKQNEYVVYL